MQSDLNIEIKDWLTANFSDQLKFNEPMARHTSFKVGGPAEIFVSPARPEDALAIIRKANKTGTKLFVAGGGTNLLVKDSGIKGIVITFAKLSGKIIVEKFFENKVLVKAPAGVKTGALCRFAIENSLEGMNFALGIPGSIGGSIRMNAGTRAGEIKDVIQYIEIINEKGAFSIIDKEALNFSYRRLNWNNTTLAPVIFSAGFLLQKGDKKRIKAEAEALIKLRNKNQPVFLPSAGCIFKNPNQENPAGKLIDLVGLKGMQIGQAQISDNHANFIVNKGGALASDIISLITLAKKRVYDQFKIRLETEVEIVG